MDSEEKIFLEGFESCQIPKAEWTHEAHLRMAWLYLEGVRWEALLPLVRERIQKYNRTVGGNPEGYHETVTAALLRIVAFRRMRSGGESWKTFKVRNNDLFVWPGVLLKHYRKETLFSPEARKQFVEPDLTPLPV